MGFVDLVFEPSRGGAVFAERDEETVLAPISRAPKDWGSQRAFLLGAVWMGNLTLDLANVSVCGLFLVGLGGEPKDTCFGSPKKDTQICALELRGI